MYNENLSKMFECCIIYFLLLGLSTEETILSSLTNLSYQSSSAATSSLEQFFSSLLSSITTRGSELFSELQTLKVVFDAVCVWSVLNTCVQYVLCLWHVHCYVLFSSLEVYLIDSLVFCIFIGRSVQVPEC